MEKNVTPANRAVLLLQVNLFRGFCQVLARKFLARVEI